jgi:hypothetical protein
MQLPINYILGLGAQSINDIEPYYIKKKSFLVVLDRKPEHGWAIPVRLRGAGAVSAGWQRGSCFITFLYSSASSPA